MKIDKIINNNLIRTFDNNGKEVLVMGCGLGFQKKIGDTIDQSKIEKIYAIENKSDSNKLMTLLSEIPLEYIQVSNEIISYAKYSLGKRLNDNIYISLTDHISFAISRAEKNLEIKNAMLWDIKRLHKDEFDVGIHALRVIKENLNVELPEDEAASIAMHILNGELDQEMPEIVDMIKLIEEILKMVKYHFNIEFDEDSINYYRFVTHLKFFTQRLSSGRYYEDNDNDLFDMIKLKYPKSYECTKRIEGFVKQKYNTQLTKEEMLYLIIHTARVVHENC